MPSTSAVYVSMHRRRAAKLVAERVDGVSVDEEQADGSVAVRLDDDATWVATIETTDAPPDAAVDSPAVQIEYATGGSARVRQKATQVRRLLTLRAR